MPEEQGSDRRRYPRFQGLPLVANIGGKLVRVIEISAGGMRLEAGFRVTASTMRYILYPVEGTRVLLNQSVGGTCLVVRETETFVSLRFDPATYRLVKFIAECTDVAPEPDAFLGQ